jgi:hypothetical protein
MFEANEEEEETVQSVTVQTNVIQQEVVTAEAGWRVPDCK